MKSVDAIIKDALSPIGYDVAHSSYLGKSETYFVFNYNTQGDLYCDDAPEYDKCFIQVHFFAPRTFNPNSVVRCARQALFAAGATWPTKEDATDDECVHIVLECELEDWLGETDGES